MNKTRVHATEQFVEMINNLLYNKYYTVSGELNANGDDFAVIFSVRYTGQEEETSPTIELAFDKFMDNNDHEIWAVVPTLSFPTLTYSIEKDYADSIEYNLNRWSELGNAVTDLNKLYFDFTDFVEQNEEAVESATDMDNEEYEDDEILSANDIIVRPGDEEIIYLDKDGMFGEPGEISLADIKEYWSSNHEYDPSLTQYHSFNEWFNDTRKWLYAVEGSKSIIAALEDETEEGMWKELLSKMVTDSDGFYTDYILYESLDPESTGCAYICMFGDKDVYAPDESYADMTFDDLGEAEDWFHSYTGFADDDDIMLATDVESSLDDTPDMFDDDEDEDEFVDLTPEMFYSFFDATVDDETKDLAAKLLCKWYMLEGAEELPTKTDILDMVDVADSEEDAAIVLTALGEF